MSKIKVVNIDSLSYVGTTWLNLLLGSHPDALTIGPPHRMWGLKNDNFKGACLVHGPNCEFWSGFAKAWDKEENFFESLSLYSGKSIFFMDNATQDFLDQTVNLESTEIVKGRYLRDARASTASYARKMVENGMTYQKSIQPGEWFYASFMSLSNIDDMQNSYRFVIRYEDAVKDQKSVLKTVGDALGIQYDESAYRFWEIDHHITVGNQGPISMVKLHHGVDVGNFESRQVYETQLANLKKNPTAAFSDERWKTQLTKDDLQEFDKLMGAKNEDLGYRRDRFDHSMLDQLISTVISIWFGLIRFLSSKRS